MSNMTEQQKMACHKIIHTAALSAGAGNFVPVPGTGVAADMLAMSMMAMSLASVFGANIPDQVAKGMAITALKQTMLKQPIRAITKELAKLLPFLGQAVAPVVSAGILEAAGWSLANQMALEQRNRIRAP